MKTFKMTLLAATALAASATTASLAAEATHDVAPMEIAAPIIHAAEEQKAALTAPEKIGIAALATAALAAFYRLVGGERIAGWLRGAAPIAAKAAKSVAAAPVAAAKAVGRAAASPFRFLMAMAGLGLFAFTGISVFDLEWAAGLIVGGALVAMTWLGATRTRKLFKATAKPSSKRAD